jgi:DegV family protein with EDD domain
VTGRVAVVTDSTAYLPDGAAEEYAVRVVPLQVTIDDRCGDEGVDISADDVATALRERRVAMRTSRPAPVRFQQAYDEAVAAGATAIVVVTISAALSGTLESATIAARDFPSEVSVVDSRSTAMGLGFAVLAAARAAAAGGSLSEVAERARSVADATRTLFSVDTLDYLKRGGRIGAVRALVGTAFSVKPILHIDDGQIALLEKVRTASRARARMVELATAAAGDRAVDVALHHVSSDPQPDQLATELRARLPQLRALVCSPLGAAIAAHVGPGAVGAVIAPA